MTGELAIIGYGARTPLGFDSPSTAAAVRAGIAANAEHPFMIDRFGEPITVSRDAGLDPGVTGPERLAALAVSAAQEALAPLEGAGSRLNLAITVSIGEERPGQDNRTGAAVAGALSSKIRVERVRHRMVGHAGGILAMGAAQRLINEGSADVVLAGGVDSYLCRDTLEWLDDDERLHSERNIYGFCPGEAAAFVLLAKTETARRLDLTPLASIVSIGSGIEENLIGTEDICLGEGLASAFRVAATALGKGEKIDRILCDMNGERYRGNEYGFAVLKVPGLFRDAADFEAPADCWGDVGAATTSLCACLVLDAEVRDCSRGPLSLIWASSEAGQRSATILRRWERD